jgi:hypothetical protein
MYNYGAKIMGAIDLLDIVHHKKYFEYSSLTNTADSQYFNEITSFTVVHDESFHD